MYQYQVPFGEAVMRAFNNYCCFTGRASRSEYWWFALFNFIAGGIISWVCNALSSGTPVVWPSYIYGLIMLLPSFGLLFRRLHDTGRSGWNWLWGLIPLVGAIILIVFCCQASQPEDNKYGAVPNLRS